MGALNYLDPETKKYKPIPVGGSGSGGLDIYSTEEETVVGTWIDGKPVYRRVFDIGTNYGTSTSWINLPQIVLNSSFETIISGKQIILEDGIFTGFANMQFWITSSSKRYSSGEWAAKTSRRVYFILEYTKTTD